MIKRAKYIFLLIIFFFSISHTIYSQSVLDVAPESQYAFINSVELLEFVPGKVDASKLISGLNDKYKDELVIMQNDYNSKYAVFLSSQNSMAESIKLRRMQELFELEQGINKFMNIAQEDIESQENNLILPLKEKLKNVVDQVGLERGFICIYDKANSSIAFLTPNAIDANPLVKAKLQSKR